MNWRSSLHNIVSKFDEKMLLCLDKLDMRFRSFLSVIGGMCGVAMRDQRMMRAFFNRALIIILCCFPMVFSSFFVALGGFTMVFCGGLHHDASFLSLFSGRI